MDTNEQSDNRVITLNGVTYHRLENITYLKKLPHADSDDDNDLDSTWLITKLKHCEAGEIIYAEIDDAFLSHYTYLYFPIEPSTVDPQWLEKTCQQTPDESLITCDVVLDKPMGKIPADIELDWNASSLRGQAMANPYLSCSQGLKKSLSSIINLLFGANPLLKLRASITRKITLHSRCHKHQLH